VKPARLRPQAEEDLLAIARWYASEAGAVVAARFFDAARAALETVELTPGIGSPRLGLSAGIEGLRSWPAAPFPVRWFYFERDDHLDVMRVLGERQDVVALLRDLPD